MLGPDTLAALKITGAAGWTFVYILIVRRGSIDRVVGMPPAALAGNLGVELAYAWPLAAYTPGYYSIVYAIWLALDIAILIQTYRFGPDEYRDLIPRRFFSLGLTAAIVVATALVVAFAREVHDADGRYSAFFGNIFMSALFIVLLRTRGTAAGQSLYIAAAKGVATAAFTVMVWGSDRPSTFVVMAGLVCGLLDALYFVMLRRTVIASGERPWRRL
jgi:hypothetical protein